jgi:hypothetical protein
LLSSHSIVRFQKEQSDRFFWAFAAIAVAIASCAISESKDTLVPNNLNSFLKQKRKNLCLHRDLVDELDSDYLRSELTVALSAAGFRDRTAVDAVLEAISLLDRAEASKLHINKAWAVLINNDPICAAEEGLLVQIVRRVRP